MHRNCLGAVMWASLDWQSLLLVSPGFPQVRELGVAAQATKLGLPWAEGKQAKTLVFWQKDDED